MARPLSSAGPAGDTGSAGSARFAGEVDTATVPPAITPARAAVLFGRLRLRFLLNGLRTGGQTTVLALLSLVSLPIIAGIGLLVGLAVRTGEADRAPVALALASAVAGLAALVGPALLSGHDDSLSPERLAPYPLSRRAELAGQAAATATGPIGVGAALGCLALAGGAVRTPAGAPLALLAAVELWLLLTVTSRVLATALAGLATTRRGRDLNLALSALVAATAWVWGPLSQALGSIDPARQDRIAGLARWSPPGALGWALGRAGTGSGGTVVIVGLAYGAVGIAVAAALWWLGLGRASVDRGSGVATRSAAAVAAGTPVGLFSGVLGRLPRTTVGAVAARELRLLVRDPRRRVAMATLCAAAVMLPAVNLTRSNPPPAAELASAGVGLLVVLSGFNQLGSDGKALWIELLSGRPALDYLRGRSLAALVSLAPVTLLANVVVAALIDGWSWLPGAVLTGWAVLVLGLGAAAVASVAAPAPVPERGSPFGSPQGQGCLAGLVSLAGMLLVSILLIPTWVGLILLRHRPGLCTVVGLATLAYAIGLRELALRRAAARMAGREPELMAAVMPRG